MACGSAVWVCKKANARCPGGKVRLRAAGGQRAVGMGVGGAAGSICKSCKIENSHNFNFGSALRPSYHTAIQSISSQMASTQRCEGGVAARAGTRPTVTTGWWWWLAAAVVVVAATTLADVNAPDGDGVTTDEPKVTPHPPIPPPTARELYSTWSQQPLAVFILLFYFRDGFNVAPPA